MTMLMTSRSKPFLSTPSARRATDQLHRFLAGQIFLSTPSARRATGFRPVGMQSCNISIHALREEGDLCVPWSFLLPGISIHALREEGDCSRLSLSTMSRIFLSTPSARRATLLCAAAPPPGGKGFLSTPSARRATCRV